MDIRASGVTKTYDGGKTYANRDISLRVEPGEVFGLLGPNGAGKSTLVKQIIGLLKPTAGSLHLGPHELVADPDAARQLCSYLPQAPMPIESFKVHEAIRLTGEIRGGDRRQIERRAGELIEALQIEEWRDTLGARLSGGVRRLVGFVMVTVVPGRLVILDEPTNDVDPLRAGSCGIRSAGWARWGRGDLVTHNVLEAEKSVDRLAVISDGRVVAEGPVFSRWPTGAPPQLMLTPGVATPELPSLVLDHTRVGNNLVSVIPEEKAGEGIAWAQQLMSQDIAEEYALAATTLEDAYIRLTGELPADEPEGAAA